MNEYKLSPLDIKELDENNADTLAVDHTLKVALQYHSNLLNELKKKKTEWWQKMAEKHGFDTETKVYKTTRLHGSVYIVEVEA